MGLNLRTSLCSSAPQAQGQGSPFHDSVHFSFLILKIKREKHWGHRHGVYIMEETEEQRNMERILMLVWGERHTKCVRPRFKFLICCFHWPCPKGLTLLSWEQYSTFSFLLLWQTLDLPSPFPFQITFYLVFFFFTKGLLGLSLPQVNKPCSWANRAPT